MVSLRHTLHESNAAADFLAKKSAQSDSSFVCMKLFLMTSIILANIMGIEFVQPSFGSFSYFSLLLD